MIGQRVALKTIHQPIITKVCSPIRSQKSLNPKLAPILPRASLNWGIARRQFHDHSSSTSNVDIVYSNAVIQAATCQL